MPGTEIPMREFLLWANCPNNCQFCWQKKLAKPEMLLTEEEKLQSVEAARAEIDKLGFTDILIVGGEVFCPHSAEVNAALKGLFEHVAERVKAGQTRQLYANSNMLYGDTTVLYSLFDAFEGIEDKLRFTTSFDIYGRYASDADRSAFLITLRNATMDYPKIGVVVNTIMTQQACENILTGAFDLERFMKEYGVRSVNLIPYIPIEKGDIMMPSWSTMAQTLQFIEGKMPHYLEYYLQQLDWSQPRLLKEYHKGVGYVECTSQFSEDCGHNVNYKRAMMDDSCFVCRLKEMMRMNNPLTDDKIRWFVDNGYRLITIGDMCSSYVWTNFRQPDIVVFDDAFKLESFEPILPMVRKSGTKRIVVNNSDGILSIPQEEAIRNIIKDFDGSPVAIQTTCEEDEVLFACMLDLPAKWVLISGDSRNEKILYSTCETLIRL